jgi:hypothetical protein
MTEEAQGSSGPGGFSFLVVGLARNCQASLRSDVLRITDSLQPAKTIRWLIVESDSVDDTVGELSRMQSAMPDFRFASLGQLRDRFPRRTERLSICRNHYLQQIRQNPLYREIDYVVVADLDGVNTRITRAAFATCWKRADWDMCAANQDGPYYDIWALRHPLWSPNDCWAHYRFLNTIRPHVEENLMTSVYSRMLRIPPDRDWIPVDSAFGGLAVYRREMFELASYDGINADGEECCEHVHFHAGLKRHGARLFINPALVNAGVAEQARELRWFRRLSRRGSHGLYRLAVRVVGRSRADGLKRLMVNGE